MVSDLVAVLCCVEQGALGRVLVVRGSWLDSFCLSLYLQEVWDLVGDQRRGGPLHLMLGGGGGGIGKLVIDSGFFASCHLFIFNFIMVAYWLMWVENCVSQLARKTSDWLGFQWMVPLRPPLWLPPLAWLWSPPQSANSEPSRPLRCLPLHHHHHQ